MKPRMLLFLSSPSATECLEDLTGDVALQAANDVLLALPLLRSLQDVVAGSGVSVHAHERDRVDSAVQATITAAVEAMARGVAG